MKEIIQALTNDEPCYYCGKMTNRLSANPNEWSIPLCHRDEPGKVKYHHIGCVSSRLVENQPQLQKYPREWEIISNACIRLKVFGGWVIEVEHGACYVPDPNHSWVLEDEKSKGHINDKLSPDSMNFMHAFWNKKITKKEIEKLKKSKIKGIEEEK